MGLLAAVTLLLGAIVDGGFSTPTRHELREPATASPALDRSAPRPTETGKDLSTWDRVLPSPPAPTPVTLAWVLAVTAVTVAYRAWSRHCVSALRAARHRGPPAVV